MQDKDDAGEESKEEEVKVSAHDQKRAEEAKQREETLSAVLETFKVQHAELMNGFLTGFSNATLSGPLCEEPMQGACFIVSQMELVNG